MNYSRKFIGLFLLVSLVLLACSTVPITGRQQLNLVPTSSMLSMSFQQYDEFLKSHELSDNKTKTQMVKRVGNNIKNAVEEYYKQKNLDGQLGNYDWEFNLIESDEVNAWCMPGGKVVIYTGILPLTKNEAGLAVVMGHEIAHAVAKHGNERMSQQLIAQMGGMALAKALEEKPEKTQQIWMAAFGIGAQVGFLLPYSRLHENEADELGLIFMAMAGYNPNEAVDFWERMAAQKGAAPPEFLSTHPTDTKRIQHIKELMPKAMKYYNK